MNKFVIAALAATALVPVGAAAQKSHSASHSSSQSVSHSTSHSNSGVSWQQRGHGAGMQRHHGKQRHFVKHGGGGKHMMRGRHHGGMGGHHKYQRINRGFHVPNFWWGPRFHIQNWNAYGFQQPMHGRRWVRYYDDALLIDDYGRVHDGRWGMNWDDYSDQWDLDENGVPYYDDGYAQDEDYDWESEEDGYAGHRVPPPPPMPCPRACGHPGYGHGGYGGGYMWIPGGMITVTETTVHAAAPQTVTETVYIKEKVKTKPRRSYKRTKLRPRPGERG
jgi:Ni/Co efflux regulator RcnB